MTTLVSVGSERFSLVLALPSADGMPEILAFGKGVSADQALAATTRSSRINGMDEAVPSSVFLPTGGLGFFGWPALSGHRDGRDFTLSFSGWTAEADGKTTTLSAQDRIAGIGLSIVLQTCAGDVISASTTLTNLGEAPYQLDRCMAGTFLLPDGEARLTSFTGMWGREFQTRNETLGTGIWSQENRRGRTSHDRFPVCFVETGAQSLAFTLGWSGNHQIVIDRIDDGRRLVHLGELFEPGEIRIEPGASYTSPTAYAGSDSAALHAFVRRDLTTWPTGHMFPRPVTLNTWEGTYFDHRVDALKAQASAAAELGIERFVLDDGWFGRRDDDTTSLGDWEIDTTKYPDGLKPLVDHVTGLGMEFGIWFEPEMINPVSELYRAHPDWVLQVDGRPLKLSRNQLVLDLSRKDVSDLLFAKIDRVLKDHAISYIKWDMNRDLTQVGDSDGRASTSAQTRAFYALLARIRTAHPHVEIESCASGGGRIDFGVLKHTHRVWTSDCTDALERLEIQRGASALLPPELLGSHVSASPNHQTGRRHSLAFRALVAMAYHMGVELNPLDLPDTERAELAAYIETHKRLRALLHADGAQFRIDPVDGRYVWGAAGAERIAVFVAQGPQMVGEQPAPLKLPETITRNGGHWRIARSHPHAPDFIRISDDQLALLNGEIPFALSSLSSQGLPLPMLRPESALLIELEPANGAKSNG